MRKTDKHTFFWGTSEVFSNWHPCKFVDPEGQEYNCSEQYMMAHKARTFNDKETLSKILKAGHPSEQKKLGRLVKGFDTEIWENNAMRIVYKGCKLKFEQNPHLLKELFATKGTTLVEASPYDKIWGIGMRENDPGVDDPKNWRGDNLLGKVLTELRDNLLK